VRGIAFSVSSLPPGSVVPALSPAALLRPFGAMFSAGVSVIAPVLFVLLLTELALGLISRVLPQMNVFFVGIPAKILVGLSVLALTATGIGQTMTATYASIFRFWDEVLR
jgi:flagellar biosynthesis protein FliR